MEILPDHDRNLVRNLCKDLLPGNKNRRVRKKGRNGVIKKIRAMMRYTCCQCEDDIGESEEKYEVHEEMEGQEQEVRGRMNENEDINNTYHAEDDYAGQSRSRSGSRSRSRSGSRSRSRSRRDTNIDIDRDIDDYDGAQIGLDLGYNAVADKYRNIGFIKENSTRNVEIKNDKEKPSEVEVEKLFIEVKKKLSFAAEDDVDDKENLITRRGHEMISVDSEEFINIMTNENISINMKKKIIKDDKSNKNVFGIGSQTQVEQQFENPNLLSNVQKQNGKRGDMEEIKNIVHEIRDNEQLLNSQSQPLSLSPSAISPYSSSNLRGSLTSIIHRKMALNTYNESIPRALESNVDQFLITKFRILFLGVLRLNYMKQIKCGRLPRRSRAALILLNSIDVGMATVHTDGLQDWDSVKVKYFFFLNLLFIFIFYFYLFFLLLLFVSSFISFFYFFFLFLLFISSFYFFFLFLLFISSFYLFFLFLLFLSLLFISSFYLFFLSLLFISSFHFFFSPHPFCF